MITTANGSVPAWFRLDEAKARGFLRRALRRHAGTLGDGEGEGARPFESWELKPGWDLMTIFSDETGHVEDLVHEAAGETGVITCEAPGADIELLIDTPAGGDWMYQWRVSLPGRAGFAICNPYREDLRQLGLDDDTKAKGCRTALGILREAVTAGNILLDAYARARGRITWVCAEHGGTPHRHDSDGEPCY